MSMPPNLQPDPTMEEILASIRKIIAEDHPVSEKAAQPNGVRSERHQNGSQVPADILELTDEVPADEAESFPSPVRAAEDDMDSRVDAAPKARAVAPLDDLISESARQAMGRAFAKLDVGSAKQSTSTGGGALEGIFARAVQEALTPVLQLWVDSHKAEIMENLKPLIRGWMDDHLPRLIEAAVRREIGRLAAERLRRR